MDLIADECDDNGASQLRQLIEVLHWAFELDA